MKKTTRSFLIAVFGWFGLATGHAQIVYVAQNATGNGSSWANATGNLKTALDSALPGTQIWVKKGTYYPTTCSSCDFSQRNLSFTVPNGVKLYGGFAGDETAPAQRNISANLTFLSGDIDQDASPVNNSFSVVYTFHVTNLTEVDGFVITGGYADENTFPAGSPQNSGAGWFNTGATNGFNSSPVVRNCRFTNNYAWSYGGAMVNDASFTGNSTTTYENCIFSNNIARTGGGAVFNTGSFGGHCSPTFESCSFNDNDCSQADGGAVFNIGSEGGTCNPVFIGCSFENNTSFRDGGAIYSFGKNGNSSPSLTDCVFENNAGKEGGAIYNDGTFGGFNGTQITGCRFSNNRSLNGDGGAVYNSGFLGTCNPVLTDCLFEENVSAFAGGAVFNNGAEGTCNATINHCRFVKNEAISFGGAMYNQGRNGNASPTITNCLFAENLALSAGAVYNLGANQGNANALITNCTFYKNSANVCGAVYANAGEDTSGIASPTIVNCIFWENKANDIGDIFRIINGTPTISHSLVDKADCTALYNGNGGSLQCNGGMVFNQNPGFAGATNGDFHLLAGSPAIDAGDNQAATLIGTDLDHLPRIFNGTVDLGVYEFGSTTGGSPVVLQQPSAQSVCEGASASFSVSATGDGPLAYQWSKNGQPINGATGQTFSISSAAQSDAGSYTCLISNGIGSATSQQALLSVQVPLVVSVSIMASQDTVCAGEEITLTAVPVNGGSAPFYQWAINGNNFGGNIQSFKISALNDGDTFTCALTSSEICVAGPVAFSNSLTINVETSVEASLSIVPDETSPCEGQNVSFTAFPEHGGTTPSFQWAVNGNPAGSNSPAFVFLPQPSDVVQCTLVSSLTCTLEDTVHSDAVAIEVVPNQTPSVVVTPSVDSVICIGADVTFQATVEHGGDFPVYEWLLNGSATGDNVPFFLTNSLNSGDEIACRLTSSLVCLTQNPVLSNRVVVAVDSCEVNTFDTAVEGPSVLVYPNPATGRIFVEILGIRTNFTTRLLNTHGQVLLSNYEKHPTVPLVKQTINLDDFPQGVYYFQIITDGTITTERIVAF